MKNNKRLIGILIFILLASVIRYLSFRYTSEGPIANKAFFVGVVIAIIFGVLIDFIFRKTATNKRKRWLLLLVLAILVLLWIELAVGIFNTPFAGS
ncbi:hypothetical protein GCM10011414_14090 [Croceivirga lutea]|uniref:hypothetical protein n=1 Tax=Croceivirga lutea TaxID=1775167 RepID=UPI00163A23F9|nr:hypothetical protein [Croceivirga lutea]GGG45692.1 hypothetical protein GCM10011414_14090 [Croceivirga lutea]